MNLGRGWIWEIISSTSSASWDESSRVETSRLELIIDDCLHPSLSSCCALSLTFLRPSSNTVPCCDVMMTHSQSVSQWTDGRYRWRVWEPTDRPTDWLTDWATEREEKRVLSVKEITPCLAPYHLIVIRLPSRRRRRRRRKPVCDHDDRRYYLTRFLSFFLKQEKKWSVSRHQLMARAFNAIVTFVFPCDGVTRGVAQQQQRSNWSCAIG